MIDGISLARLSPFGVEVKLDLAERLSEPAKAALRDLFATEGVLVMPGQALTMEQQVELCKVFGPVVDHPFENFYVSNTRADGVLGTRELLFHSDIPFLPVPYPGASLHAVELSDGAAATRFVSAYRAYDRLPQALRDRIASLNALQVRERARTRRTRLTDLEPGDVSTVHPVVGRQRGTGRPYLFVNEDMTACIIGLSESESEALLEELFGYLYAEEAVYVHEWKLGDIVIWDNLGVQHARHEASTGKRTLQRVTLAERGYAEQYPSDCMGVDLHNQTLLAPEIAAAI
jgi:taurine dioxygenase